jgi:uncharacterized protein YndB with AHSA1/START domain
LSDDAIEREIFIRAGIEHVWRLVSKTGFWIGDELRFDIEAREGETAVIEVVRRGRFPVRVERLEPPRYAAYCWASAFPGAEPDASNSTLVEFRLVEQDGGVLVRFRESGFAALRGRALGPGSRRDNVKGWARQLERFRRTGEGIVVR